VSFFSHNFRLKNFLSKKKVKVKCTLVQALRLCTGRTAHRGSRGIALPFHDHGTRRGWRGQRHTPAALYPRERPGTHCTGGWVGPRAGLDRCGKSRPTGIRSQDRPARSQFSKKNWARYDKKMCIGLHVKYRYSFLILMKIEFCIHIFEKYWNTKFNKNMFERSWAVLSCTEGHVDRRTATAKPIVAFRNFRKHPKTQSTRRIFWLKIFFPYQP
jgi:hypothetical protein